MSIKYNLIGKKFGSLTVIEDLGSIQYKPGKYRKEWKCICDCGNEYITYTSNLTSGKTTMCSECGKKIAHLKHRVDYTGQRFGMLVVKDMLYNYNNTNHSMCVCDCDCGTTGIIKSAQTLKSGKSWNCGCQKGKNALIPMTGNKYGRLTVLKENFDIRPYTVECLCECGEKVVLRRNDVLSGHTQSCGCLQKERAGNANTIDFTGIIAESGVELLNQAYQNEKGVWVWECKCPLCGDIFYAIPARVLNGYVKSCGCINQSFGEQFIEKYLKNNEIDYISQYVFADCKGNKGYVLRFDFAVFDKDENLFCCLEYDGKQHYEPIDYFGGNEGFKATQERDKIKDEYCRINGISLFRFPYWLSNDEIINQLSNILKSVTTAGGIE